LSVSGAVDAQHGVFMKVSSNPTPRTMKLSAPVR
jgi:hypothetical protein